MTAIARVLRVKSRLEIAEGQFDEAFETITMGYRLGENMARSVLCSSTSVGNAIARMMNESVRDWIDAGGPNLYWALAGLPNPLVDIRPALQQEMHPPAADVPVPAGSGERHAQPDQWRQIIGDSLQTTGGFDGMPGSIVEPARCRPWPWD